MFSKGFSLLPLLILLAGQWALAAGNTSTEEVIEGEKGTKGYISRWGGGIRLLRELSSGNNSNVTLTTGEIKVTFEAIRELNNDGKQSKDKDNVNKTIDSFSGQNFTCLTDRNATMANSDNKVKADCLVCSTDFTGKYEGGQFRLNACMIKNNGTIKQQDESANVTTGQLKFTIEISKWSWCAEDCPTSRGEFLELDISIKLPAGANRGIKATTIKEAFRPKRFDLGAGSMVEFSTVSLIDGTFKNLTGKTPSLSQEDGNNIITLRFPRFEKKLMYDPTIDTGNTVWPPIADAGLASATFSFVLIMGCLVVALSKVLD